MLNKKPNYYKLFTKYCHKHYIWFAICANGTIDELTDCYFDFGFSPDIDIIFGTKRAYEWLIKTHKFHCNWDKGA